jgi:hypothetical protein
MPSDNDHIEESSGQPVIRFGERDNALLEGTRNGTPLDLAGTENLTDALRWCEHAFNEDVLPPRARVEEPREFYAAANMGCLPRSREQAPRKQVAAPRRTSTPLPHATARGLSLQEA